MKVFKKSEERGIPTLISVTQRRQQCESDGSKVAFLNVPFFGMQISLP